MKAFWLIAAVISVGVQFAQTDLSTIRGTVADASGSVVPNCQITLKGMTTNLTRSTTTNADGNFEIPYLKAGAYQLMAVHPGFTTFEGDNILLETNQIRRVDVSLTVGEQSVKILVTASEAAIETEGAKISGAVTDRTYKVTPFPSIYAMPWDQFLVAPGFHTNTNGLTNATVAGLTGNQSEFTIDGIATGYGYIRGSAFNNELLSELKLTGVNNSAEFSRAVNSNAVTKSGTNELHGDLHYYLRNEVLNAKPYFAPSKPSSKMDRFGGSLSGPVVLGKWYDGRNRTFFFFDWTELVVPSSTFAQIDVPTARMRAGDFSQLLAGRSPVVIRDPLTGLPFLNNVIPNTRLSPISLQMTERFLPLPNQR